MPAMPAVFLGAGPETKKAHLRRGRVCGCVRSREEKNLKRRARFVPPSAALYRLERLSVAMSLLSPEAQKIKAKEYFCEALRFLQRGDDACSKIGGGQR